ncbi:MAG TPA: hypothetical protein VGG43_13710 [Acidimicrobiales bacterium]|jgi:hypothetical protein
MSTTDYIVNGLLIALVIRQIHGKRLTAFGLIWPVAVVVYAGYSYLHGVPTAGNDLLLVMTAISVGATLGILCGAFTHLHRRSDGSFLAKAGFVAAILWIVGVGSRLAFEMYATHGGSPSIAHFSATHSITSAEAWTSALILMAFAEVLSRTGVLAWRARSSLVRTEPLPDVTGAPRQPMVESGIMGASERPR